MSHSLHIFVELSGVPEKQQVPMVLAALKKSSCDTQATVRRMKKNPWIQVDGIWPDDVESQASAVSADIKTKVVVIEEESTSGAFRYLKYDWQDQKYGVEVARWLYGYETGDGWESCWGDLEDGDFSLIYDKASTPPGQHAEWEFNPRFVIPKEHLQVPDVIALGKHLGLPGIDMTVGEWTEEKSFEPPPKVKAKVKTKGPQSFFDLMGREDQLWDIDEVQSLIDCGVDPNQTLGEVIGKKQAEKLNFTQYQLGDQTPLERALEVLDDVETLVFSTIKLLLKNGADPNKMGVCNTPLYSAVTQGETAMASLLLEAGAKIKIKQHRDDDQASLLEWSGIGRMRVLLDEYVQKEAAEAQVTTAKPARAKSVKKPRK